MVKALKRALKIVSNGQDMTEDTFRTFVSKAMALVNDRPISKIIVNDKVRILTPSNFLVGFVDSNLVPAKDSSQVTKLGIKWKQVEQLMNSFWIQFMNEILPELGPRTKWQKQFGNLEVDTVVLLIEPTQPRNEWLTGLVTEVKLSEDNIVRSATVKVGNKLYERPVVRLIPIVMSSQEC